MQQQPLRTGYAPDQQFLAPPQQSFLQNYPQQWYQAPDGRWYPVTSIPRPGPVQPYYAPQMNQVPQGYGYPAQQPYPMQQSYYPPPPVYSPNIMVAVNQSVNIGQNRTQYPFIWRLLYFLCIGWWFGLFWLFFALGCFITVIGIPVGVIMLNFLPSVMTLQRH